MKTQLQKWFSITTILTLVISFGFAISWAPKASFTPGNRSGAFAFSIGQNGYVGCGAVQAGATFTLVNDFWEYNKSLNTWTQKATLPGIGRISSATFQALNKGYVSTGYDLVSYLKDTWQYDPIQNTWTQVTDFPGDARYTATGFDVSDYGFVGMGKSLGYYSDFFRYNASVDTWTQIDSIPGIERQSAKGFSINDYGYVTGGANESTGYDCKEMWRYDPIGDIWSQMNDYPGNGSHGLAGFVINGKGFVGTGTLLSGGPNAVYDDFYTYDPGANAWSPVTNFTGGNRLSSVSMSIGNSGFLGMGSTVIYPLLNYQSDWWTFDEPTAIYENPGNDINVTAFYDGNNNLNFQMQNSGNSQYDVALADMNGKLIYSGKFNSSNFVIEKLLLESGIYFYAIKNTYGKSISGKVMNLNY